MKRRDFLATGLAPLAARVLPAAAATYTVTQVSGGASLKLENEHLAITVSGVDGSLTEVQNKLTGESHQATATTFSVYTGRGEFTPATAPLAMTERVDHGLNLLFRGQGAEVAVRYRLAPGRNFIEKTIAVKNTGRERMMIEEVIADRLRFTPAFIEAYAHDDGTDWKCPINVFLRTKTGGLFAGIENPYFEMIVPGAWKATRVDLRYSPRWLLNPGDTFDSEPAFLGVYRKENIYFFKELQQFAYMKQQQVVLDWGEVWAMQAFMRDIQPSYPMPYPGYYFRANCVDFFTELGNPGPDNPNPFGQPAKYWPPHSHCKFEAPLVPAAKYYIDRLVEQGNIPSLDLGTIWLGNSGWCRESPGDYLENLPESWPIQANPYWKEVVDYAHSKGLGIGIMDEGGARDYMKNEVRWKVLDKQGRPIQGYVQQEGYMGRNCWANVAFAKWWVNIVSRAIREYDVPIWGTDAGSIWWVPFDPPLECYATDHGHPPGECGYYAWRNIMWAGGELRRRHPRCALRNAGGMHRGYPWVLRDWMEFHGYLDPVPFGKGASVTDNVRFQCWHAYNTRFIPPYKTAGGARTDDKYGIAYGFFSYLTRGDHGMASLVPPIHVTAPGERAKHLAFWRKWSQWANENVKYMGVRRDVFGEPRSTGIDGCAHCIDGRGYIFAFNPTTETRAASAPLNEWIGLSQGDSFTVREIYPAEQSSYGKYNRGEEVIVPVPPHDVVVLEIGPESAGSGARPRVSSGMPVDKAFLNAREVRAHLGVPVSIPGESSGA